ERLVETARAELGPIDLLVNNAAITIPGRPPKAGATATAPAAARAEKPPGAPPPARPLSLLDFPLRGFKAHFDVNLFAAYRLMQLVLPDMIAARGGAIINI